MSDRLVTLAYQEAQDWFSDFQLLGIREQAGQSVYQFLATVKPHPSPDTVINVFLDSLRSSFRPFRRLGYIHRSSYGKLQPNGQYKITVILRKLEDWKDRDFVFEHAVNILMGS